MAGFSNDVLSAINVDFRGTKPVTAQVTADGQLLIGATASPNIRVGSLTSTDGSVTITPGPGTLDLSATSGGGGNQDQIYYVGKHGNNANSGLNIAAAKLTFGSAITAASALTPSATNRFAIVCFDDGIYTENITDVPFVDIFAPNATLSGTLIVDDNCNIKFYAQNASTGTTAITKPAGSTYSNVEIEVITLAGTANGCTCSTGFLNLTWKQLYVVNGYGIGDISVGLGHLHIKGGDIYISGTGIGIIRANTGSTVGRVDHILDIGAGTGSAIIVYGGTVDVSVSKIDVTNAYQVQSAGSILNLFVNELIGTTSVSSSGVANVTLPGEFLWSVVGASAALVPNTGIFCTTGAALSFSLPATSAVGDVLAVSLDGSTSWTITQAAGQQIRIGNQQTTLGTGGSLASTAQGDYVELICEVANTRWFAKPPFGTLTVI